jgi:hypothetical protein
MGRSTIATNKGPYSKPAVVELRKLRKNPILFVDGFEFANIVGCLKIAIE